jgi:hypothetical protein
MNMQLLRFATKRFPRLDYLDERDVRHARRELVKSINYLRSQGKWILDQKVGRKCENSLAI